MIDRTWLTWLLVAVAVVTARGDDSPAHVKLSVADAILGLNSPVKEIRSKSVEQLIKETDDLWEADSDLYTVEADKAGQNLISGAKPHLDQLITLLNSDHPESVSTAALVLAKLGADARSALPALQKLFQSQTTSTEVRTSVLAALLHITPGEKPLGPFVLDYLESLPDQQGRELKELSGQIGKDPYLGAGIAHAGIAYAGLIIAADRTLVETPFLAQATSPAYPLLIRVVSIDVLGHFQCDAESAVPALQKLLHDREELIQRSAALALVRIQHDPAKVQPLIQALRFNREEEKKFRQSLDVILKERQQLKALSGSAGAAFVQELIGLLKCKNGFYRRQTIIALGDLGPAAKPAIPALKDFLQDSNQETARRAAEALRKINATGNSSE